MEMSRTILYIFMEVGYMFDMYNEFRDVDKDTKYHFEVTSGSFSWNQTSNVSQLFETIGVLMVLGMIKDTININKRSVKE